MKLAVHDNSMETNAEVVSQDFGIGDIGVIIGMLRKNVYQYRIRTLVQEYMCNGRDATREIKSTKRIIVTIPNELSPVFKVRDFGPGITPQRMSKVFLQYGNSTKRGSNGQTGGFGIGAKSAWSYTDSFTVVSITGGVKRTYVCHTGVNNQGRADLMSEVETTEDTGTEIHVAVNPKDIYEFRQSVQRACHFWAADERPDIKGLRTHDVATGHVAGLMIGKSLEINASQMPDFIHMDYHAKALLVIDGVPYPVGEDLIEKIPNMESLLSRLVSKAIIHIGNGVLEVAMSRESVADSEYTVNQLSTLADTMESDLKAHITKAFKLAKTNAEWIKAYKELSKLANVDDYSKFGDYKIERNMVESVKFADIEVSHVSLRRKRRSSNMSLDREPGRFFGLDNVDHVYVCDTTEPVVTQNRRLREYLERTNRNSMLLINATEKKIVDPKWVRPAPVAGQPPVAPPMIVSLSFKDSQKALKKIITDFSAQNLSTLPYTPIVRVPKAKRDRTKEMFTIHECTGHSRSNNTTTLENVEQNTHVYLYVPYKKYHQYESEFNDLQAYFDTKNISLCGLTEDTINTVQGCKLFKPYEQYKTDFKPDAKTMTAIRSTKANNKGQMKLLGRAKATIKDKHLAAMVSEYKSIIAAGEVTVPKTLLSWCKAELAQFATDDEELTNLLKDEYPLVKAVENNDWRVTTEQIDELVFYINAKAKGK